MKRYDAPLDIADFTNTEQIRRAFVHDFQYRYHKQSDHYTVVALFVELAVKQALEAKQ